VELAKFEYVAFMVPYSSWRMADAIEWAAESARLLGDAEPHAGAAKARLDELHALLKYENAWSRFRTFPDEPEPDTVPAEPVTAEEMTLYVRDCMKSWFEHVQKRSTEREASRGSLQIFKRSALCTARPASFCWALSAMHYHTVEGATMESRSAA
jgi:hypothetical protein